MRRRFSSSFRKVAALLLLMATTMLLMAVVVVVQADRIEQTCTADGQCSAMEAPQSGYIETDYGEKQVVTDETTMAHVQKMDRYMHEHVFVEKVFANVRETCKNNHEQCAYWAALGECEANPKYMKTECAPACQTCQELDFFTRCPYDAKEPGIFGPGDLNKMFRRITEHPFYEQYNPQILAQPGIAVGKMKDNDSPWVVMLDNFLTKDECEALIQLGADRGYEQSTDVGKVKSDGTFERKKSSGRTSNTSWCLGECYNHNVTQQVVKKVENLTGIPDTNSEYYQLLRYEENQFYNVHHDFVPFHMERKQGPRMITVFLYLNDVEAGGGTNFPDLELTVQPKQGRVVLWPSVLDSDPTKKDHRTQHAALPVEAGVKFGANAWIHYRDFKETYKRGCS